MTKSNVITLDSVVYLCYLHYIIVQSGKKDAKRDRLWLTELLMGFQDHWRYLGTYPPIYAQFVIILRWTGMSQKLVTSVVSVVNGHLIGILAAQY